MILRLWPFLVLPSTTPLPATMLRERLTVRMNPLPQSSAMTMPPVMIRVTAWLKIRSAVSWSLRPKHRLTLAAQPSPCSRATALTKMDTGKATLTAAMPVISTPCPIKI